MLLNNKILIVYTKEYARVLNNTLIMKLTTFILFMVLSVGLSGQNAKTDSLRNAIRNDARWAITHAEYSKGEKLLDSLILVEPSNPRNYFVKAESYYYQIKEDSLMINLDKSLLFGMDSIEVLNEVYDFYTFQKVDNEKRVETVNKMIVVYPTDGELYMKRRGVKIDLGDYEGAMKDLEIAAALGNLRAKESIIDIEETSKKIKIPR